MQNLKNKIHFDGFQWCKGIEGMGENGEGIKEHKLVATK